MKHISSKFFFLVLIGLSLSQLNAAWMRQIIDNWSQPADITQATGVNRRWWGVGACDGYENMHIFWSEITEGSSTIYYRNDIDTNWSIPNDILISQPTIYFLAAAISKVDDTVHLAWANNEGNADLYYSRAPLTSAKSSRAWSQPKVLAEGIFNPAIQVDPNGIIHIVFAASDNQALAFDVIHISSADGGETWSEPSLLYYTSFSQPYFIRTEMAIDGRGRLHVGLTIRSQEYAVYSEVGYIRSQDGGLTWEEYRKIADTSTATAWQGVDWIAPYAFGDDEIHLTWHDPRRMHQFSMDGGESWTTPDSIMSLGAAFGGPNHLAMDSSGTLHAVTAWSDGVYSVDWDGAEWGAPQQIDSRQIDPHGQHIYICQGNQLHTLYYGLIRDNAVWYSTRTVGARHIERKPLPTPQPKATDQVPTATHPPSGQITPQANGQPDQPVSLNADQPSARIDPMRPILLSMLPVLVLIAVIFAVFRRR